MGIGQGSPDADLGYGGLDAQVQVDAMDAPIGHCGGPAGVGEVGHDPQDRRILRERDRAQLTAAFR